MGAQGFFAGAGSEGQDDDRGAEPVAQVILYQEHRTLAALLRADHRIQIGKIYVTAFHACSRSDGDSQRAAAAADGVPISAYEQGNDSVQKSASVWGENCQGTSYPATRKDVHPVICRMHVYLYVPV